MARPRPHRCGPRLPSSGSSDRVSPVNDSTGAAWASRHLPEGPARVLLAVIARHPEVVEDVLHATK